LARLARRVALALSRRHLPDHQLALRDLFADGLELLFVLLLLAKLLWPWHWSLLRLACYSAIPAPASLL
jgi:hypothetical protein